MSVLMKTILILVTSINLCFAIDVDPIKKGEPAPKDGFFIDSNNLQEMRQINEEKKLLEKENIKLEQLRVTSENIEKNYQERLDLASKQITKEQVKGDLKGIGGFLLGVLATSAAAFAAAKVLEK